MQFGCDKGPYIYIERGNQVLLHEKFSVNGFELN